MVTEHPTQTDMKDKPFVFQLWTATWSHMTRAREEHVFLTRLNLHKTITPGNAGHKCRLDVQSQSTRMRHTRTALSRIPSGPSAAPDA